METPRRNSAAGGFTLVELLVVLVILAVAGAMVVPLVFGMGDVGAMSAARLIAADLQYAQNVAITSQTGVTVTFDEAGESYRLSNASGLLKHPMTKADYVVAFGSQQGLEGVDVVDADFEGQTSLTFDELGSPNRSGAVTVRGGSIAYRIDVAPVTGIVTVTP